MIELKLINKILLNQTLRMLVVLVLLALVFANFTTYPQITSNTRTAFKFAIDSLCVLSDPHHSLASFYRELDELEEGKDTVINIVHLGDSHIQAGYLSGSTMRMLQSRYGNAGRGWISPLKIGRTNEPDDYYIRTSVKEWIVGRCVQTNPLCDTGIGGIGIQTKFPFVSFDVIMTPNNGTGYAYNQILTYRGEKSMPLQSANFPTDFSDVKEGFFSEMGMWIDTIRFPYLTDSSRLQTARHKVETDGASPISRPSNLYYGFNLLNGDPGILYHSIGINGAMYVNYTTERYVRRLAALHPSLLILSLGTNESFSGRFNVGEFTFQVETFISLVKRYIPKTAILLITPPECYKRAIVKNKKTYVRNDNIEKIARALTTIANKHELAYWDFFKATGGRNSSINWYKGQWMNRDRVHFNKEAYYEQGLLLYYAITNGKP